MARAKRVPPPPESTRPKTLSEKLLATCRRPFYVDETTWRDFQKKWREIDQNLPFVDDDPDRIIQGLRESARDALRAEVVAARPIGPRWYLIPV